MARGVLAGKRRGEVESDVLEERSSGSRSLLDDPYSRAEGRRDGRSVVAKVERELTRFVIDDASSFVDIPSATAQRPYMAEARIFLLSKSACSHCGRGDEMRTMDVPVSNALRRAFPEIEALRYTRLGDHDPMFLYFLATRIRGAAERSYSAPTDIIALADALEQLAKYRIVDRFGDATFDLEVTTGM
jgi:hypothetical protein